MRSGYNADTGIGRLYDESNDLSVPNVLTLSKMSFEEFNALTKFIDAQLEHARFKARKALSDQVRTTLEP